MDFKQKIAPFFWVEHSGSCSVCLEADGYLQEVFDTRAEDGFEGNGYDWASLATVFLEEKCPQLIEKIHFDPEADMFCAYSEDTAALEEFICLFKVTCEERQTILDLFSRAELD